MLDLPDDDPGARLDSARSPDGDRMCHPARRFVPGPFAVSRIRPQVKARRASIASDQLRPSCGILQRAVIVALAGKPAAGADSECGFTRRGRGMGEVG
ncbi:hypothetical protein [Paracoccus mutanolyticus]|uniref:hypothetical protein n=1 Tax=Paracoccus mutanolyticus TaxID=1499308 RepID=UPI0011AEAE22|nr:hypothetical protein [Paracoccus mutanolyticus]